MKGPGNTEVATPTADGDKAQTPQPTKHKLVDVEAPNSEPQVKHKKLTDELSDEEFEEGLMAMRARETAKRIAGTVTPNPRKPAGDADKKEEDSDEVVADSSAVVEETDEKSEESDKPVDETTEKEETTTDKEETTTDKEAATADKEEATEKEAVAESEEKSDKSPKEAVEEEKKE